MPVEIKYRVSSMEKLNELRDKVMRLFLFSFFLGAALAASALAPIALKAAKGAIEAITEEYEKKSK